jgi:N-acetylglucosamine-6-phosphate deacetylase
VRLGVRAALAGGVEVAGDVEVEDGRIARLGVSPAGGGGLRLLVGEGATLAEAVHAVSRAPALLAGHPELGLLEPGAPADLAILDHDLRVTRTLVAGA